MRIDELSLTLAAKSACSGAMYCTRVMWGWRYCPVYRNPEEGVGAEREREREREGERFYSASCIYIYVPKVNIPTLIRI